MKVFISWSGERSRKVAELLHWWVKCVIQAVDPWVSSSDVDRGTLWFSEIIKELSSTTHGIICITSENKVKPWILFEAGALAKGLDSSRIYTFLVDLQPADIENPLAQFNHTRPNREDLFRLIFSINNGLENGLKDDILRRSFDTYWPQFEESFKEILENTAASAPPKEERAPSDILSEILSSVRGIDKRVREIEVSGGKTAAKAVVVDPRIVFGGGDVVVPMDIDTTLDGMIKKYIELEKSSEEIMTIMQRRYGLRKDATERAIKRLKKNM